MWRSASLPGPAAGVAGGDFGHHLRERVIEIDLLRIGETDHDEENIRQLHGHRSGRFVGFLLLRPELMVHFPRQLADFFSKACHVHERREVAFLELADPAIHRLLRITEAHGLS